MAKSKQAAQIEWFGGIYSSPPALNITSSADIDLAKHFAGDAAANEDAAPPAAPPAKPGAAEVLVWMTADGTVLGKHTYAADQAAVHAVEHFLQTTKAPTAGAAHQPQRLVVGDSALAEILRKGLPAEIKIAIEHTMELDDLMMDEFELYPADIDATVPAIAALLRHA
ncbi:MAG: hypothetical protein KBG15_00300 [Kofleriaceae bacterium]|nr:hypothetical protein [Kofleriaceae bacterium]